MGTDARVIRANLSQHEGTTAKCEEEPARAWGITKSRSTVGSNQKKGKSLWRHTQKRGKEKDCSYGP